MKSEGKMVALVKEYIVYRRSLGFRVSDGKDGGELIGFGRYADRVKHAGAITTALAITWAKSTGNNAPIHWARRLDLARGFARYRSLFDPDTEIPPPGILGPSRYHRKSPHIYSDPEIGALLKATSAIRPRSGLRPRTYSALFGLLACTGMRVSEALALNNDDVDMNTGLLTVRWSKFGRSRLVPIHRSTVRALLQYQQFRNGYLSAKVADAFFANENGTRLPYYQVQSAFHRLRRKLGWTAEGRARRPRIHDLRHTFAVHCILRWYKEGANVDQKIAALATYLGHVNVTKTYWYLTGVPELMAVVGDRFERFSHIQTQPRGEK